MKTKTKTKSLHQNQQSPIRKDFVLILQLKRGVIWWPRYIWFCKGKGGVGKSFISSTLAQHRIAKGKNPLCIDTDPVNATFYGFKNSMLSRLMWWTTMKSIPRKFDDLIELIANTETDVIIDNGASTFVPMSHYLISNQIPALLLDMGHELVVHTVITGSQALLDTLNGFVHPSNSFRKKHYLLSGSILTGARSPWTANSLRNESIYRQQSTRIGHH